MTDFSPHDLLSQGTCAVLIEGKIAGTAWLVSQQHLLTAGHVLGTSNPLSQVEVQFIGDIPRQAGKIECNYHERMGIDFAILKLSQPLTDKSPLPLSLVQKFKGKFHLRGYGESLEKGQSQWGGEGRFVDVISLHGSASNYLFQLHSEQLRDKGFSGGAIYSEEEKAVVAIQIEAAKTKFGGMSGMIFAMPLYRIANLWEPLKEYVATTPTPPPEPPPISSLTPQAQAALKTCFERNRPHILAALPADQHQAANEQMNALHRTFLNPPPDLKIIRSTLAFLSDYPSALRHIKILLQEPTLQRLVRRGGAERRRKYEEMAFGGEIAPP